MEKQLYLFSAPPKSKPIAKPIWQIYIDGASRNNPGPSGAGVYITYGDEIVCKKGFYLGKNTNNQAEYLALLIAAIITDQEFKKRELSEKIVIISDSELLVKQMNGKYRVKNPQLEAIKKVVDTVLKDKSYTVTHVLREKNKIADALANSGIDLKKSLPKEINDILKSLNLN
jgi:ribonuclease HI